MAKKFSQAQKDKISDSCKDSWKDPTKRVEQKKRIEARRLLKHTISDRIEPPNPLNIENARQAPIYVGIDEIKKDARQILLDVFIEYLFMRGRRPLREILNNIEKAILIRVLSHVNGNQGKAAKFLGLKYTTLHEKIKKYNIKFIKKIMVAKIEKKNAQDK